MLGCAEMKMPQMLKLIAGLSLGLSVSTGCRPTNSATEILSSYDEQMQAELDAYHLREIEKLNDLVSRMNSVDELEDARSVAIKCVAYKEFEEGRQIIESTFSRVRDKSQYEQEYQTASEQFKSRFKSFRNEFEQSVQAAEALVGKLHAESTQGEAAHSALENEEK